jgi:small-conductance mechanosensitive channel
MAEQATLKEALKGLFTLEKVVAHGSHILAIVVVSWLLYFFVKRAIRTAARTASTRIAQEARRQRVTTVLLLVGSMVRYVIIFMALMMVLRDLGVNLTPILAGAGVVGLAVGFGAQNLVRDVVSGFFIIMEGQYAVGDLVEINAVLGRVEEVGLRVTKLRDPNGELRYFANGSISTANNYTEDYVGYVVNIPLPPEEPARPAEFARAVFEDFDREFRVLTEPPSVHPVESLPTYARLLRVRVNAIPGRHSIVEQKLPARVTAALERAGHPVPTGTEVTVSLLFPPPGARA